MRWDENIIERVKEASDVVDVVGQHVSLKKSGANFKGLCPFHQEKTPSFTVNASKQIFHCFGCNTGGDVIRFVMLHDGLPFADALRKLAGRAGIDLPEREFDSGPRRDRKDLLYRANRIAFEFFSAHLMRTDEGRRARDYLQARGIHSDVSRVFGLGYAPKGWRNLLERLKEEGIDHGLAVECGLAVQGDGPKEPYDRFRDRVVFPIRDLSGRVLGFGGRVLDDQLPKYINTPETPIYRKGDSLFGMDVAASHIRDEGSVILTEGYLDVISLHQGGIRNVVGVLGTALTGDQARRIRRLTDSCVLLFDGDEAGTKAALRSGMILLEAGFQCQVAPLEPGQDPDSYLRDKGREMLTRKISRAQPIITFALEEARRLFPGGNADSRVKVLDAIVPYLAKIGDRAKQGVYLKEVAEELKIEQHDLRAKLSSLKVRKQASSPPEGPQGFIPRREELLVHIMIRNPSTVSRIRETLTPEDFTGPGMSGLVEKLYAGVNLNSLVDAVDDNLKNALTRWALEDPVEGVDESLDSCLRWFAQKKLERNIQEKKRKWAVAVEQGLEEKVQELAGEWQRLTRELDGLRSRRPSADGAVIPTSGGENDE
ncbi:MAG: DNA primase [bacterium]|nr:MAG: DNA primase [bacterium]